LDVDWIHFPILEREIAGRKKPLLTFLTPERLKADANVPVTRERESSLKAEEVPGPRSAESLLFISFLD
jgi:hypothetical protein